MVERLTELGGCLTMDDLLDFKPEWVDPVAVSYRGRTVHVPPPPCEAFQYLVTLRILEGFDLGKMERNGVEHVDTVLRAIRVAAGVRIANGVPSPQKLAELLSDSHVESLRARVRDGKPVTGPTEQWTPPPADGSAKVTPPRSRSPMATATSSASPRASAACSARASWCLAPASA